MSSESGKTFACNIRYPLVGRIGNNMEQFLNAPAPDRRDDPELGKVSSDHSIN